MLYIYKLLLLHFITFFDKWLIVRFLFASFLEFFIADFSIIFFSPSPCQIFDYWFYIIFVCPIFHRYHLTFFCSALLAISERKQ